MMGRNEENIRYFITFPDGTKIKRGLNNEEKNFLDYLLEEMSFGNEYTFCPDERKNIMAMMGGVKTSRVTNMLKVLREKNIVRKKGRRSFYLMINPMFFYKGGLGSLKDAVKNFNDRYRQYL